MSSSQTRNEAVRLAALRSYDILDTPREQDFDEIAELAGELCGTPIAVVNLIGEGRQFFKAEVGLGVRETPLDSSFCARAILEEDFLLVPDATKDARFAFNPLVTGAPRLRFYAGALLKTSDGHAIGTVCVLDYAPRDLSGTQIKALRLLAKQVMRQLELRRALREQTLAQEAGRVGTFELDVLTGAMTVSSQFCRVFGMPVEPYHQASVFERLVIPEDASLRSDVAGRQDGTAQADVEYRVRRADDGRVRWIARRASFIRDADGRVTRMYGTVHDVTDRRRLQAQQAALLDLGDRLRSAGTSAEVAAAASETLGRTLGADRTGYCTVNSKADLFEVEQDWTAPGIVSLAGRHGSTSFRATVGQLEDGRTLVVTDMREAADLASDLPGYEAIGARAQIQVPLVIKGHLVGLLYAQQAEPRAWAQDEVDFVHGVADRTYAAFAKVQAEVEQRVLNEELSHRLKNTLAMVQAIATQTLRHVPDREPVDALVRRIHALSSAHEILLRQSWSAAPLRAVVQAILAGFEVGDRFGIEGPDLRLGPRSTLSISLLLHELATNAFKYGSLSVEGGRVDVSWRLVDGDEPAVVLSWRETGGPAAQEPVRKGFGSRLIRMGLVGTGGSELRYVPSGFEAEFTAPLAQVQAP